MNVNKPAIPQVPAGARELKVAYTGPVLQEESIGTIPADGFSALITEGLSGDDQVVRPQPVLGADGKPQFAVQEATLDLRPYSGAARALKGGAIGAAVMGIAGAIVGYFVGHPGLGAGLGVATGGTGGAVIGAREVAGDTTSVDWELRSVVRHSLEGYDHTAIPQTTQMQVGKSSVPITTGYWHTYSPRVKKTSEGEYWAPVVRHSSDAD